MERSKIYDLLDTKFLREWRETIEKAEYDSWFFERERETLEELEAELNEKSKKLLMSHTDALKNKLDYVYYNLEVKVLNFGIKIGMELNTAFADFEE